MTQEKRSMFHISLLRHRCKLRRAVQRVVHHMWKHIGSVTVMLLGFKHTEKVHNGVMRLTVVLVQTWKYICMT